MTDSVPQLAIVFPSTGCEDPPRVFAFLRKLDEHFLVYFSNSTILKLVLVVEKTLGQDMTIYQASKKTFCYHATKTNSMKSSWMQYERPWGGYVIFPSISWQLFRDFKFILFPSKTNTHITPTNSRRCCKAFRSCVPGRPLYSVSQKVVPLPCGTLCSSLWKGPSDDPKKP